MTRSKRKMESMIASKIKEQLKVSEVEALRLLYGTTTYKWFCDDKKYGIAREGTDAIYVRILSELNGNLIM